MLQNLAKVVSKESVTHALEQIIQTKPILITSTRFDIVYKGQRFPPKEVVRIAAQIQGIINWETYRLNGSESTNHHLRAKGFEIVLKEDTVRYFIGGAAWSETGDQTERFIREGMWKNGYEDRLLDEVNAIPEGSRFAIKSAYAKGSESILRIKAIGTVTHNHRNGRLLDVLWDPDVSTFDISGLGGYRTTIHEVISESHIEAIFYHEEVEYEEAALPNSTPMNHPLNTILYGPPGTGKTYHTVNKAIAIANPGFRLEDKRRKEIKDEYNRLVEAGQIQFVTFHQSMSYEDFIEGIKPVEPKEGDAFLKYRVEDGIFKRMVEQAAYVPDVQEASFYLSEEEFAKAAFYSLTLATATQPDDKVIYRYCLEKNCIALNVAEGYNAAGKTEADIKGQARAYPPGEGAALAKLVHHVKTGNYVLLCDGESTCRAIGRISGDYEYRPNDEITPDHFRSVEWLVKDVHIPREQLYASGFTYGLERLDRTEVKKDFFTKKTVAVQPALVRKNYVLIIDEINRGNVSQIFGELITLIEEDKRKGKHRDEALTVTLPYSKKPFSVPDNLYIIGTMNTADRSVEALDTALRRRFMFEEMAPKPELLNSYQRVKDLWVKCKHTYFNDTEWIDAESLFNELHGMSFTDKQGYENLKPSADNLDAELAAIVADHFRPFVSFNGLDLEKLLLTVNQRLSVLLTKDHTIGHAWLMDVYSLENLQQTFQNKILPLLQEYFYNSYEKLGLVLGERFFIKGADRLKVGFAKFSGGEDLASDYRDKVIYQLKEVKDLTVEDFKSIYE